MSEEEHSLRPGNGDSLPQRQNGQLPSTEYASSRSPDFEPLEDGGGVPLRRYLLAIRRYKWIIALAALVGLGGAYGAWKMVKPQYIAHGSLWLQSQDNKSGNGPITSEGLLQSSSWVDLLRSYAVLDTVVRREKLYLQPGSPQDNSLFDSFKLAERFVPGSYRLEVADSGRQAVLYYDGAPVSTVEPGDSIGNDRGLLWAPPASALTPGRKIEFTLVTPRDAARRLSQNLSTQMDKQGSFIQLSLPGRDPERIASVLNTVMERDVSLARELKGGNLKERREVLGQQLQQVETELKTAEQDLESFRVNTITLPSGDATPIQPGLEMTRDPVFNRFFQMKVKLDGIKQDRKRLQSILDALPDSGVQVEALQLTPSAKSSTELQGAIDELVKARTDLRVLKLRYTNQDPRVISVKDKIAQLETEAIPSQIRSLVDELESQETELADQIDSSGVELSEIPTRSIEEARLTRRVNIAENLYSNLRSRFEEARLAEASSIPDLRILDRASVPQVPVNDQRMRMALMVFLACLGSGVGATILLERFDPRFRYPDEVEADIGLSILGTIPRISNGRGGRRKAAEAHEAFRNLRTSVDYAFGSAGPLLLAVSGPSKGDGKTLVTTNLAISFAEMGRRTLVVDGDTRMGDLHEYLGRKRKPGLTNYLTGAVRAQDVIQETDHKDLYMISSGSRMARSPELLTSSQMGTALAGMRRSFDVVLFDSPPLGAGSDASILGSITGNLLLVLRSWQTKRELTQVLLDGLDRLPVRVLGAVLNDYQHEALYGAYSYYGSYLPGYEAVDEEEGEEGASEPTTDVVVADSA